MYIAMEMPPMKVPVADILGYFGEGKFQYL
jgi:hypothetical protein